MKKTILIFMLITCVAGMDNSSMTEPFRYLVHGEPVWSITSEFEAGMGGWFYIALAAIPYLGMWMYQKSVNIATIWLTVVLASYGYLLAEHDTEIPFEVFYILITVWIAGALYRVFSAKYDL